MMVLALPSFYKQMRKPHATHLILTIVESIPIGNRVGRTRRHRAVEKGFHTSKLVSKITLFFFRGFKAGIPQTAESIRETRD
jgi:hypothetical protein